MTARPDPALLARLAEIVGDAHLLTGAGTAPYDHDWTGRYHGSASAVVRPADVHEVAAVLAACHAARVPVVPQGGNTGLVGTGVPLHGEIVLSLIRLDDLGPVDRDTGCVTAGAGVLIDRIATAHPMLDFGPRMASGTQATLGGAIATNAGGPRALAYGRTRAQLRGIQAVLADGTIVDRLHGPTVDATGYDWPGLLTGSDGTLAVVTAARIQLVPRVHATLTALIGLDGPADAHQLAMEARRTVPGLLAAEYISDTALGSAVVHGHLPEPLGTRYRSYLLLEVEDAGAEALEELLDGTDATSSFADGPDTVSRNQLWEYRYDHHISGRRTGIRLDVSTTADKWVELVTGIEAAVVAADPLATVAVFGHIADGAVHLLIVPSADPDGRHEEAALGFVGTLGGSIAAEHGVGPGTSRWLRHSRTPAELDIARALRRALDPDGVLNPHVGVR